MSELKDVLKSNSVAIAGICKNAGKTTVLNSLIRSADGVQAITSIGRDGEQVDVVTATPKPTVYVRENTLFTTCANLLRECDVTKEILEVTDIGTPLGDVLVVRAKSDGYIQLCGPSTVAGMIQIRELFEGFGADRVLIDGAISRRSISAPMLCDEWILCSGASYGRTIKSVSEHTAFIASLYMLPKTERAVSQTDKKACAVFDDNELAFDSVDELLCDKETVRNCNAIYIRGGLTDSVVNAVISGGARGVEIIIDDPSKFLANRDSYAKLTAARLKLRPRFVCKLSAICINPYSAYGTSFDKDDFMNAMLNVTDKMGVPIFNVMDK